MNIAKIIKDFCSENEIKFCENYSGRFMYGRECIGVICKSEEKYYVFSKLAEHLTQYDIKLSDISILEDNMGLDIIIYFPQISLDCDKDSKVFIMNEKRYKQIEIEVDIMGEDFTAIFLVPEENEDEYYSTINSFFMNRFSEKEVLEELPDIFYMCSMYNDRIERNI